MRQLISSPAPQAQILRMLFIVVICLMLAIAGGVEVEAAKRKRKSEPKGKPKESAEEISLRICGPKGEYIGAGKCQYKVGDPIPGQMDVGPRNSQKKLNRISELSKQEYRRASLEDPIEVTLDPDGNPHITDGHHRLRAAYMDGRKYIIATIHPDSRTTRSAKNMGKFWEIMEKRGLVWLYDRHGNKIKPSKLPKHIRELGFDDFRDVTAVLRDRAFDKVRVPFLEFIWGRYCRKHFVEQGWETMLHAEHDFRKAVKRCQELSLKKDANRLPGFIGEKGFCRKKYGKIHRETRQAKITRPIEE